MMLYKISEIIDRILIKRDDFIIISNNCWGYEIYKIIGVKYNTPFVGLYMYPNCYLKLLENIEFYLLSELKFKNNSKYFNGSVKYPIGLLDGTLEIHFLHYIDEAEAKEKWERRVSRLFDEMHPDKGNVFVKFCDRDGAKKEDLLRFHKLPFKNKVSFGKQDIQVIDHIKVPVSKNENRITTGDDLFRNRYKYFNFSKWINKK
ncbi:hypothetical protein VCSRO12_2786 [Vibrio cholerae]|uniref:DUF1919 domain-containing protein n=1 Tax=Vibrio cholerae TaxID=666 RepID=UPI0011D65D94|nr:DUF1919 domain-containing protein [Vibrio cholerae]TXZ91859.1 DUF1919 domain-containing protein [Vibrio cholerae]BCN17175.1 hypothetical protein [Vibrio cholerae]GHY67728.1 hypothetical protein VCSRO12_2786 [Vibrio cholerae]